jgi:hypothetical protein
METFTSRLFLVAFLMITLATTGGWAQTSPGVKFTASAPFTVGESKFPSGTYTITQESNSQTEWQIYNDSKSYSTFFSTEPGDTNTPNEKSGVTFHKYGDSLVLKAFSISGIAANFVVETSYAEKKASKSGSLSKISVPAQKK